MQLKPEYIAEYNQAQVEGHQRKLSYWTNEVAKAEPIIQKLIEFQIAIPSWALGTGGTRFGRFPGGGEPRSLEEKIADVGLLQTIKLRIVNRIVNIALRKKGSICNGSFIKCLFAIVQKLGF